MNQAAPAATAVVNGHKMSTMSCPVYKSIIDSVWIGLMKSCFKLLAFRSVYRFMHFVMKDAMAASISGYNLCGDESGIQMR